MFFWTRRLTQLKTASRRFEHVLTPNTQKEANHRPDGEPIMAGEPGCTCTPVYEYIGVTVYQYTSISVYWYTSIVVTGISVYWYTDTPV